MSVNGALGEDKMRKFKGECAHFSLKNVPFTLTTGQVPNLALTHTKQITVWLSCTIPGTENTPRKQYEQCASQGVQQLAHHLGTL